MVTTTGSGGSSATAPSRARARAPAWQEEDREALLARIVAYLPEGTGIDTEGRDYGSVREVWEEQGLLPSSSSSSSSSAAAAAAAGSTSKQSHPRPPPQPRAAEGGGAEGKEAWYTRAAAYWEAESNCPPTVDGVLGGFGHVSPTDIAGSRAFVAQLRRLVPGLKLGRVVGAWLAVV